MASERRARKYETFGSMAYQPEYQTGSAAPSRRVREPRREERPRVQPRTRTVTRPDVEVRTQDAVAPFAIIGFTAVLLCALLLVMTSAQLAMANDQVVTLNSTLSELKSEEKVLMAQYELAFDLGAIENQLLADGSMVKAGPGQTVYLDLSEGDRVVYYSAAEEGIGGMIRRAEQYVAGLLS
ncbi:MAG: hypothetical protein PUB51_05305 [Oscillospiraceae bacterium]|nr:hypothetical protein [Oscillospiraceae bacterium]